MRFFVSLAAGFKDGYTNLCDGLRQYDLALLLGWHDIMQRYKRSNIGAFWLTANMAILMTCLGFIFGTLFRQPLDKFFPHLCLGLIFWTYLVNLLQESCTIFISSRRLILQAKLPIFIHIIRLWWNHTIILLHNLVILPIVFLVCGVPLVWSVCLSIPGFILFSLTLIGAMVFLSIICTRFRDVTQIVQNLLRIFFYATPIMWLPERLPEGLIKEVLEYNPFTMLLSLIRDPLLGNPPDGIIWLTGLIGLTVCWLIALIFLGLFRNRIPYWL